jgi:hypothetical protein
MPIFAVVFVKETRTKTGSVCGKFSETPTVSAAPLTEIFALERVAGDCLAVAVLFRTDVFAIRAAGAGFLTVLAAEQESPSQA